MYRESLKNHFQKSDLYIQKYWSKQSWDLKTLQTIAGKRENTELISVRMSASIDLFYKKLTYLFERDVVFTLR